MLRLIRRNWPHYLVGALTALILILFAIQFFYLQAQVKLIRENAITPLAAEERVALLTSKIDKRFESMALVIQELKDEVINNSKKLISLKGK